MDDDDDLNTYEGHQSTGGESFISAADDPSLGIRGVDSSVPDIMLLNLFCARAKAPKETEESKVDAYNSWQPVREWLSTHNAEEVRTAAEQRGESGLTALHFACRNVPPIDVIDVFLSIAEDTVRWPDSFGWLMLALQVSGTRSRHGRGSYNNHFCKIVLVYVRFNLSNLSLLFIAVCFLWSGSDSKVIKALAEAFPECKTTVDRRGRTPLHFALGDKPAAPDVVLLLSTSGAAGYADDNGMVSSADSSKPERETLFPGKRDSLCM
jgi:ankyrin repeat protein